MQGDARQGRTWPRGESGHRLDSGSPFWRIQLDQDLLDTISAIYPEWFKDYTNGRASTSSSTSTSGPRSSNGSNVAADSSGVLEHKVAKGDSKLKAKSKRADNFKEKDRERKDARRDNRDERDAGNGKKSTTKASPQQDKTTADVAGRKTAGVPVSGAEMAEGNQSPPKAEVDDSPLQHAMDRNKECEYAFALPFPPNVTLYTSNSSMFDGQGCEGSPRCRRRVRGSER
ncbi:myocardin-related transcription factor A isoform X2 [Vespula maculifrons]|uniref:Myocardin-related transcription factor A isoform X2 n=1 Tax=Vespula maculifrons TaxID=7453 RepID=A0ABD2CY52_VESMC